ncbi:MAG: sensor histidine kinase [Vicinamibacterales bacterium]
MASSPVVLPGTRRPASPARTTAVAPRDASQDSLPTISLDREGIARRKADKHRRYTTTQVPALRALGFTILLSIVAADRWATAGGPWPAIAWLGATFAAYNLVSWAAIRHWYGRAGLDMGTLFLAVDPFVWTGALYLTGGADSWLYFVMLVRVADQLNTSRARALGFTLCGVAAYALLLSYIALVDGQRVAWAAQVGRMMFLAGCGGYLALTAGTAERLRAQLSGAVRRARESIRQLHEQSVLLEDAREKAEAGSRAKSQFLANMSHELRTPLNAIIGYTELLQEEMPDAAASVRQDLNRINRSAQHLRGLVNDVIELSRVDAGRVQLALEQVQVVALVADVASVVAQVLRENGNTLTIVGADTAGDLMADPLKVRQILVNLLGNAGKFTKDGQITLACSRETVGGHEVVVFRVSDTGIGMNDEQLARILRFEPFVQADASITRRYGGTGLGLTISQRFSRLMGGDLSIESRPGEGSVVTCRLPVVPAPDADR